MAILRKMLWTLLVAGSSFVIVAVAAYVIFWRLQGLDHLGTGEEEAAALGAWSVFVKSVAIGVVAAVGSAIFCFVRSRRGRISIEGVSKI